MSEPMTDEQVREEIVERLRFRAELALDEGIAGKRSRADAHALYGDLTDAAAQLQADSTVVEAARHWLAVEHPGGKRPDHPADEPAAFLFDALQQSPRRLASHNTEPNP
jgi:hypothetical protein